MATGIPKTGWHGGTDPKRSTGALDTTFDVRLEYKGKRAVQEILQTPPARCRSLLPANGSAAANRLYFGDNLPILAALAIDTDISGKIRLIYIDPPYATKSVFQSRNQADGYMDLLEGSHYLEFLRERLVLLRELLSPDGSIYVHLDDNMAFLVKVVMDEIFGPQNFRNCIIRKKCNPKNYTRKAFGNVADYVLFYTKSDNYVWHRPVEAWTEAKAIKEYPCVEVGTGRRYKKVPVHAPGVRNGETGQPWRGKLPPPGKHWQYLPSTLDEMDAKGEIYWSPTGNPRRKIYFDESQGIPVQDIWLDFRDAHNQNIHISGYPTEKNPQLLSRIIQASSSEGDLVLDCFSGSGTTLHVASHLARRWIGIDDSAAAITATLRRFGKGLEPMGDFVTQIEAVERDAVVDDTLPLFRPEAIPKSLPKTSNNHRMISDFTLLAQEPYADKLGAALDEWAAWLPTKGASQLRESPRPYRTRPRGKPKPKAAPQPPNTGAAVRAPTRRHPSRHTLTSLD